MVVTLGRDEAEMPHLGEHVDDTADLGDPAVHAARR